jgi:hypothetical protein
MKYLNQLRLLTFRSRHQFTEAERTVNVRVNSHDHKHQTHNYAASGWRIH